MLTAQVFGKEISTHDAVQPLCPEGGAVIEMLACGFCGSDLDKITNEKALPGTVLGHEVVGKVIELCPTHTSPFSVGDRIVTAHHYPCNTCHYCLNDSHSMCRSFKVSNLSPGGFSEQIALNAGHLQHTAFQVPQIISNEVASCTEPLGCVLRAFERSKKLVNGSVAIIGLGFIGMMAAQLYKNRGDTVYGIEPNNTRRELAEKQHFVHQAFHPAQQEEVLNQQASSKTGTDPKQVDIVFLTILNSKTLETALKLVRDGGQIILFCSSSDPNISVNPNILYFREIEITPSYSPTMDNLKEAARLLFNNEINVSPLCTHTLPLHKINQAIEKYTSGEAIKIVITP